MNVRVSVLIDYVNLSECLETSTLFFTVFTLQSSGYNHFAVSVLYTVLVIYLFLYR